jgi:hypothetical protein
MKEEGPISVQFYISGENIYFPVFNIKIQMYELAEDY